MNRNGRHVRAIRFFLLACIGLTLATPGRALEERYFEAEAKINEMTERARAAIARGDAVTAIDLFCQMRWAGDSSMLIDLRFLLEIDELFIQRYEESFRLPANADSLARYPWPDGLVTFGGCWGVEDEAEADTTLSRYHLCPSSTQEGTCHVVVDERDWGLETITIDLDLDGDPEFLLEGDEVSVAAELSRTVDRAPDGRRIQWLLGDPGTDPRKKARIWFYRDGGLYFLLIDTDGDGKGDCGRSW